MLDVRSLTIGYDDATVVDGVSLTLAPGEIVAVLGANGAGKSTIVNTLAGLVRSRAGTITVDGTRIDTHPPHHFVHSGIALVPEGRRLFADLTVADNLGLGAIWRRDSKGDRASLRRVHELFPVLADRASQKAGTLSGGQQQMLAIGRALMARPRYLLMDEPSLGLAPVVVDEMFELIRDVHATGVAVLIVEQNVKRALELSTRGYVLADGGIALEGERDMLLGSARVREAYLAM